MRRVTLLPAERAGEGRGGSSRGKAVRTDGREVAKRAELFLPGITSSLIEAFRCGPIGMISSFSFIDPFLPATSTVAKVTGTCTELVVNVAT